MTSLVSRLKTIEKLAIDNSPVLLTAVGVAGAIGTAVLAFRAGRKVERAHEDEYDKRMAEGGLTGYVTPTKKEMLDKTWKNYIPPVVSGTVTITAIVLANHIGTKRAAALAAAYTISEKAFQEYREKVIDKIGEKEENQVRNDIVQDRVRKMPPSDGNVLMVSGGDHLFIEMYTGRYFRSDMESVRKAVNDINYKINTHGYASVSDFYDLIDLRHTSTSDEMGWSGDKLMDVDFQPVLSEDGQPCVGINFMTGPVRNYDRFH